MAIFNSYVGLPEGIAYQLQKTFPPDSPSISHPDLRCTTKPKDSGAWGNPWNIHGESDGFFMGKSMGKSMRKMEHPWNIRYKHGGVELGKSSNFYG